MELRADSLSIERGSVIHTRGILQAVYTRDSPATWSASLYRIGQRSQVYGSLLEELPKGHGYIVDDEYCVSSTDGWAVGEDHTSVRELATSMRPGSQGFIGGEFALGIVRFNNSHQASIQMAPYESLYGRLCRSPVCWMEVGESPTTGPDLIKDTSLKVDLIWRRLLTAQSQQKSYADRRRRPLEFEAGDHVFMKVMLKRGVVRFGKKGKLSTRFMDPSRYLRG